MTSIKLTDSTKLEVSSFVGDKGERYVNLRKFYKTKNSEEWKPTAQGLTLPEALKSKIGKAIKDEFANIEERAKPLKSRK